MKFWKDMVEGDLMEDSRLMLGNPEDETPEYTTVKELGEGNLRTGRIQVVEEYPGDFTGYGDGDIFILDRLNIEEKLRITPVKLVFNGEGGKCTVYIDSNIEWQVVLLPFWADMEGKIYGKGAEWLSVSVGESTLGRSGNIVIKAGNQTKTIRLVQSGLVDSRLDVSPGILAFQPAGGTQTLRLTTAKAWQLKAAPSWLSVSSKSGYGSQTLQVNASPNLGYARNNTLLFTITGKEVEIPVSQTGELVVFNGITIHNLSLYSEIYICQRGEKPSNTQMVPVYWSGTAIKLLPGVVLSDNSRFTIGDGLDIYGSRLRGGGCILLETIYSTLPQEEYTITNL